MDYDPNLTNDGRMARQTVRLTFAQWEYSRDIVTVVLGNGTGLSVIEQAVDQVYDGLPTHKPDDGNAPYLLLFDGGGNDLEIEEEESDGSEWLRDMLVAAEITSIVPEERNDRRPDTPPHHTPMKCTSILSTFER